MDEKVLKDPTVQLLKSVGFSDDYIEKAIASGEIILKSENVAATGDHESETKEDTIEPGTETLSITADPRSDGLVKARTGDTTDETTYKEWYKTVYTPTEEGGGMA